MTWTAISSNFVGISRDFADLWGNNDQTNEDTPILSAIELYPTKCTFQRCIDYFDTAMRSPHMGLQSEYCRRKWRYTVEILTFVTKVGLIEMILVKWQTRKSFGLCRITPLLIVANDFKMSFRVLKAASGNIWRTLHKMLPVELKYVLFVTKHLDRQL